jgi:hypothetical protein
MSFRAEWKGDFKGKELKRLVADATVAAMDELDAAVAEAARHDHPGWQSQTGETEASIHAVPAQEHGQRVVGGAGYGVAHGRFLEFTARGHPGDRTINRAMERLSDGLARRIRDRI